MKSSSARVLLVDPESEFLALRFTLLKQVHRTIVTDTAESISEALTQVSKGDYDAVVCKVQSPDEVSHLVRLRNAAHMVPLVAVTPTGKPALEDLARESGADDVQTETREPLDSAKTLAHSIDRLIFECRDLRGRGQEFRAETRRLVAEHRRIVTRNRLFSRHRLQQVTEALRRFLPLIVEKAPQQAMLTRWALKACDVDCPIPPISDGAEAIRYLEGAGDFGDRSRHPLPTLVLLDNHSLRNPDADVLAWIRNCKETIRLPVYVLADSLVDSDRAMEMGATDCFLKPSGFPRLVDVLRAIIVRWWFFRQAIDDARGLH